MRERSLWLPAAVLTPLAAGALWLGVRRLDGPPPWLLIAVFGIMAVVVADWPHWVAQKVVWSNTVSLAVAAAILSPPATAPVTSSVVLAVTAFYAPERKRFRPARFITNAGLLTLDGAVIGFAIDAFGPTPIEPSSRLFAATGTALVASAIIAIVTLPAITAYRYGREAVRDHFTIALKLPLYEAPIALSIALIAATAAAVGHGWVVVTVACAGALVSFPVMQAQLAAYRTTLISSVAEALDHRGLAAEPQKRMETLALRAGRHLRFPEHKLQQLRYVCLTYAMTDLFCNEIARPLDVPYDSHGLASRASRVLFYGLALDDVADPEVNRLGECVARLDALMFPEDDDGPLPLLDALGELREQGIPDAVIDAIEVAATHDSRHLQPPGALPFGFSQPSSVGPG